MKTKSTASKTQDSRRKLREAEDAKKRLEKGSRKPPKRKPGPEETETERRAKKPTCAGPKMKDKKEIRKKENFDAQTGDVTGQLNEEDRKKVGDVIIKGGPEEA